KKSITQRVRWIKGYFESRKKYIGKIIDSMDTNDKNYGSKLTEIIGVWHYIIMIIGAVLFFLSDLVELFYRKTLLSNFANMILLIFMIYFILLLFTLRLFVIEKDKINLNEETKVKALFFNPIFLASYVRCALIALFKKEVKWDVIEHKKNM
ncbi:MAG: hypothetical protein PUF22_03955, partial [Clostridium sp.]|nr:hypothetical protein [Clostridium sp.]